MNEQLTYTIILHWSEEQGAYMGQAQELVGIEGSGSTYEEALASVLEAIRALAGDEYQAPSPANAARARGLMAPHQTQGNSSIRVV